MRVDFQTQNSIGYKNNQPAFSALIIKDGKFWSPEKLDRFVRNKEIQKLTTVLDKQGKDILVAKAQITGTPEDRIFIHLKDGLKKIAHIKESELTQFSADKALKEV